MRYADDSSLRLRARRRRRFVLALFLLVALVFVALGAWRVGPAPKVTFDPEPKTLGRSTAVPIEVSEPSRGLSHVTVELEQNGERIFFSDQRFTPVAAWKFFGTKVDRWNATLELGKDAQPKLREGVATLRVVADRAPSWLRSGSPVIAERQLEVRLTPPTLELKSIQHYVKQGGCEAVVYRVGASSTRDGVRVGDRFFPGWPVPHGSGEPGAFRERFALFAVPYNVGDAGAVKLVAADEVGNQRSLAFVDQFFPAPPKPDTIELTPKFLERVVPSILAGATELTDKGDLLANFLQINGELRRANAATLVSLAAKSRPEFLWKEPFLALPGGRVMASFADHRSYFWEKKKVDEQDHLGFDLASTERAPVPASNRGVVVWAKELGIFGNAIVIDHGYGLMSLYAHLSQIDVHEGDTVERSQILGKSGSTGLAGGDHLHFSFLLQGLPVRPTEWWDPHWITDRIQRKLGAAALPFSG
jgi:murein DD-endopeptidase MepM/ murein hydrolase activator NlpD